MKTIRKPVRKALLFIRVTTGILSVSFPPCSISPSFYRLDVSTEVTAEQAVRVIRLTHSYESQHMVPTEYLCGDRGAVLWAWKRLHV